MAEVPAERVYVVEFEAFHHTSGFNSIRERYVECPRYEVAAAKTIFYYAKIQEPWSSWWSGDYQYFKSESGQDSSVEQVCFTPWNAMRPTGKATLIACIEKDGTVRKGKQLTSAEHEGNLDLPKVLSNDREALLRVRAAAVDLAKKHYPSVSQ